MRPFANRICSKLTTLQSPGTLSQVQPNDAKGLALADQRAEICVIAPNLVQALANEPVALQLGLSLTAQAVVFLRAVVRELPPLLLLPLPS
jgi:hypothetical protein